MTRPIDPRVQALVRASLSRRSVLLGAAGLAALAACGTGSNTPSGSGGGSTGAAKPSPAADRSATDKVVRWANWTLYLDYDENTKKYPTLEAFQKKTGIKATYSEDIDDNDTYYGKIQIQLRNGRTSARTSSSSPTGWPAGASGPGRPAARQGGDAQRQEPLASQLRRRLRPGPQVQLPWQSGSACSPGTRRRCPAACARSATCGSPSSRAGSRCCRRCATRSG